MAGFELSKWYADCVGDRGDAAIFYRADLRLGPLPIRYASMLRQPQDGPARALYTLRPQPQPTVGDGAIAWEMPQWKMHARWTGLGAPCREVLFESEAGVLEWECLAPRARVAASVEGEPACEGWGYVEHLRLTVPPWKLPIRRLRWGRFVNADDAVVWIDWAGPYARRVVYVNGERVAAETVEDGRVEIGGGAATLMLEPRSTMRDGRLGETALAVIPRLGELFPQSLLQVRECKWLSRATLRRAGRPDSCGVAIHEVVEWP